jgi:hypothetical protein
MWISERAHTRRHQLTTTVTTRNENAKNSANQYKDGSNNASDAIDILFFFSAFAAHLAGTQYTKAASATKGGASRVAPKQRNQKPKKRGK